MEQLLRTYVLPALTPLVLASFGGCLSGGCMGLQGFPNEFSQVADVMVKTVADQGVLNTWASNLDGNIQDPGLESYVNVKFIAGVRVVGVNGEVSLDTEGAGTQLPKDVRTSLIGQLDGPISDAQRNAILAILGWNREQVNDGG